MKAIKNDFGGFERFRSRLTEVASTIMGSGWAALVWEPIGKRLLITQIYDHQSNLAQAGVPLMVVDAWEHAYYLQYQNRKSEFFESVWKIGIGKTSRHDTPPHSGSRSTSEAPLELGYDSDNRCFARQPFGR